MTSVDLKDNSLNIMLDNIKLQVETNQKLLDELNKSKEENDKVLKELNEAKINNDKILNEIKKEKSELMNLLDQIENKSKLNQIEKEKIQIERVAKDKIQIKKDKREKKIEKENILIHIEKELKTLCKAKTKSNLPCGNTAKQNGYCGIHKDYNDEKQNPRFEDCCQYIVKTTNMPCRNKVSDKSISENYCSRHLRYEN